MYKIPIEIVELETESYHLFVSCEFNGKKGEMIIDTGASKTVLDSNFIDSYTIVKCPGQKIISAGLGGEIKLKIAKIKNFSIGDFRVNEFQLALVDLSNINNMYAQYCEKKIAGLIGSDFLLKHKAIIDYNKKKMFLNIVENNTENATITK